jgi:DNA gyrase subunit A
MEVGLVKKVDIDGEMQQSYLDYAMSVIVARALPDARDGLKPVQRRILYAMYDMGLRTNAAYKKSARIVGEVLGKYHPHGDMAVYEAMARMAQDFSMRYLMVDGQGNFGSVDGDPPAAMRYTEARLQPFALDMLSQIERDTVNFLPNFDESLREPEVLPAALPNLLVNGSTGIAVGMATNVPPHNISEVVDALVYMLQHWEKLDDINVSDLMQFVKGPDYPTGGILLEDPTNDLLTAYATGRGRMLVRGRVHMEDSGRGRTRLIITELPYMTNKSSLIERIADLVREGGLEGISDLRDESDRQGMRIVIELNKSNEPEKVLRELYKRTPMQSTLGISILALVDGEPRLLSLKQALKVFVEHRLTVVRRRSEYDLLRAQQRAHLLEGLRIAIANLDEIIKIIRAAADVETARDRLIKRFKLTEIQAQAILDMPLRRLAALERKKIEDEYKEVVKLIKELESLLQSPKRMREVVRDELLQMKQLYGDRRRTQIVSLREGDSAHTLLTTTDLTPAEEAWVGVSAEGLIARTSNQESFRSGERQSPRWLVRTDTHHTLYLVSESGQTAAVAVHSIPEAEKVSENGVPLWKASPFPEGETLAGIFSIPPHNGDSDERFILSVTAQGLVKKTQLQDLPGPSSQRFTLVKINQGDRLVGVTITEGSAELLLVTARGMSIRFSEGEVRSMGLVAAGVNGIKLGAGDQVVAFDRFTPDSEILLVAADGGGWRLKAAEFPLQGRYGMGVIACKPAARSGIVGMLTGKPNRVGTIHFENAPAQPIKIESIPLGKRQGTAKSAVPVKTGDAVTAISATRDSLGYWNPELVEEPEKPKKTASSAKSVETPKTAKVTKGKEPAKDGSSGTNGAKAARSKAKPAEASTKPKVAAGDSPATIKTSRAKQTDPAGPKRSNLAAEQPSLLFAAEDAVPKSARKQPRTVRGDGSTQVDTPDEPAKADRTPAKKKPASSIPAAGTGDTHQKLPVDPSKAKHPTGEKPSTPEKRPSGRSKPEKP